MSGSAGSRSSSSSQLVMSGLKQPTAFLRARLVGAAQVAQELGLEAMRERACRVSGRS